MAAGPTPRDRILAALAFEEADIVPYHLMLDEKYCLPLTGYFREEGLKQRITNHLPFYNLEKEIVDFLNQHDHHFKLCGIAYGFFDRGWALRGMENFLMDFVASPGFVQELFESLTNLYLDLINRIAAYPIDGIHKGADRRSSVGKCSRAHRRSGSHALYSLAPYISGEEDRGHQAYS